MAVKVRQPEINIKSRLNELDVPPQAPFGMWEHIDTWVSDGSQTTVSFNNILNNNYTAIKVIVGCWGSPGSSDEFYMRYLDQNGNQWTDSVFYGVQHFTSNSGDHRIDNWTLINEVRLWEDIWSSDPGGVHGEIDIYNFSAPMIDGKRVERPGAVYRPILRSRLVGYDTGEGYASTESTWRYNNSRSEEAFNGIIFYNSALNPPTSYSYMAVYGLKMPDSRSYKRGE